MAAELIADRGGVWSKGFIRSSPIPSSAFASCSLAIRNNPASKTSFDETYHSAVSAVVPDSNQFLRVNFRAGNRYSRSGSERRNSRRAAKTGGAFERGRFSQTHRTKSVLWKHRQLARVG